MSYEIEPVLKTIEYGFPYFPNMDILTVCEDYKGNLGLGCPCYFVIDGLETVEMLHGLFAFSGSPNSLYADFNGDGVFEMVVPLNFDVNADGINDFAWIVDMNNNGIPDASPYLPFYAEDTPEYKVLVSDNTFLDKSFDNYSVSEGFLFLIFFAVSAAVIKILFGNRRKY